MRLFVAVFREGSQGYLVPLASIYETDKHHPRASITSAPKKKPDPRFGREAGRAMR